MEGVDFNPSAALFAKNLAAVGHPNAVVHQSDLRAFTPAEPYDVVASFGLIEHFSAPEEILLHHHRLLRPGGLCVVVVPWFRQIQWLFHRIFDRADLERHNLAAMDMALFEHFATEHGFDILHLGHVGVLRFWWREEPRSFLMRQALRVVDSAAIRLSRGLHPGPAHSPWLVFVGRRHTCS